LRSGKYVALLLNLCEMINCDFVATFLDFDTP
jgi:hypothetical protein